MFDVRNLVEQIKKARLIFVCGNGGSASTAEHFVTDLIKKGYPAICLNSNVSVITMIANDYGYSQILAKQIEVLGDKPDLLITISCSGNSDNIKEATLMAFVKIGMSFYQFETFGEITDYGLLENKHLAFAHEVAKSL